ncbi:MAG TPA: hypothetical protein V6C91_21540 [Coleofasciculaceae cyanobacterium]
MQRLQTLNNCFIWAMDRSALREHTPDTHSISRKSDRINITHQQFVKSPLSSLCVLCASAVH